MEIGKMENFTIDQFAGSMALILGSIGGLLMIIWKSRCHCKFSLCGLCSCERKPPEENESDDEETKPATAPPPVERVAPPPVEP